MGALIYGPGSWSIDIDDYLLAHVQVVVVTKLRRRESFTLTVTAVDSQERHSIWLNDAIPLVFRYQSPEREAVDRELIESMMIDAVKADGLRVDARGREPKKKALSIVD